MTNKNIPVNYYQTLKEAFLTLEAQKISIMTINVKRLEKMAKKYQKFAKILDVEILQDIPFNLEIIQ